MLEQCTSSCFPNQENKQNKGMQNHQWDFLKLIFHVRIHTSMSVCLMSQFIVLLNAYLNLKYLNLKYLHKILTRKYII